MKVLEKPRGGDGMIGGWGERPASELILGTLSSLTCGLADIVHWGLHGK